MAKVLRSFRQTLHKNTTLRARIFGALHDSRPRTRVLAGTLILAGVPLGLALAAHYYPSSKSKIQRYQLVQTGRHSVSHLSETIASPQAITSAQQPTTAVPRSTSITINGQHTSLGENGSLYRRIPSKNGTTTIRVSVHTSDSQHSVHHTATSIHVQSLTRSTTSPP